MFRDIYCLCVLMRQPGIKTKRNCKLCIQVDFCSDVCIDRTGDKSDVTNCLKCVAYRLLPIPYCLSPIAYRLSAVADRLSPIDYAPSPIANRLSPSRPSAYRLSPIAYRLSPVACRLSPVAYSL